MRLRAGDTSWCAGVHTRVVHAHIYLAESQASVPHGCEALDPLSLGVSSEKLGVTVLLSLVESQGRARA